MAFIRRCNRSRRFSTLSFGGPSGELLAAVQEHVKESGQALFSVYVKLLEKDRETYVKLLEKDVKLLEKDRETYAKLLEKDRELLEKDREALMKEKEKDREALMKEKEYLLQLNQNLLQLNQKEVQLNQKEVMAREYLLELRARDRVALLTARGLNDTRGLFEMIQEELATKLNISSRLKGADLWEAILHGNAHLALCIQKCTKVSASNVTKQALCCYLIYSILSQHVHGGKSLAQLQHTRGGTITFERGPLSSEEVDVLMCMGAAAQVNIQENT